MLTITRTQDIRTLLVFLSLSLSLLAVEGFQVNSALKSLNTYKYETPQGSQMKIPKSTRLLIIAFEKDTSALVNEFLDTQDPFFMPKHRAIFIADINKMPTIITNKKY